MAATIAHAPLPHMASLAWQTLVERMGSLVETKKIQVNISLQIQETQHGMCKHVSFELDFSCN